MPLTNEDLEQVVGYLQANIHKVIPPHVFQLSERIVRVEESLEAGFRRMDERFEALQTQMDQRFEAQQIQLDQRFEAQQIQLDRRFDDQSRHISRWMAVLTLVMGIIGVAMTATNLLG